MKRILYCLLLLTIWPDEHMAQYISSSKVTGLTMDIDLREKVYLHTDKAYYNLGDIIRFKVYLLDAFSNRPLPGLGVVYVDILDTKHHILESTIVRIENGTGHGDFLTSRRYGDGRYLLRAYTSYMRNFDGDFFFRKEIYIDNPLDPARNGSLTGTTLKGPKKTGSAKPQVDLRFFPEGGDMVEGLWGKIGVKAVGLDGLGVDLSGEVVTTDGSGSVPFQTNKFGMSSFYFVPEKGKNYKVRAFYKADTLWTSFPKVLSKGPSIKISEHSDRFVIQVRTTEDEGLKGFQLHCTTRKGSILKAELKGGQQVGIVNIPKKSLEMGIVRFSLLDVTETPRCERLVFYGSGPTALVKFAVAAEAEAFYGGDSVGLKLSSLVLPGALLSLSITHADAAPPKWQGDIRSYLLLESEIKGYIEDPGYYFYSKDRRRKQYLDDLMLTQGWRRFILDDTRPTSMAYRREYGITISGQVRDSKEQKISETASVLLMAPDGGKRGYGTVLTNKNGRFEFPNVDLPDEARVTIQANKLKDKGSLFIQLDTLVPPMPLGDLFRKGQKNGFADFLVRPDQKVRIDAKFFHPEGLVELEEVTVTASKKSRTEQWRDLRKKEMRAKRSEMYARPSNMVDTRELAPTLRVLEALRSVPNVRVIDSSNVQLVTIRGHKPLYLLDGFVTDSEMITSMTIDQVDFIDVFKGSSAAIFGYRGMGGAVAVYTKNGTGTDPPSYSGKNKVAVLTYHGFKTPREFYEPKFEAKGNIQGSTLFWKPDIQIGDSRTMELIFSNDKRPGTYRVDLQGITPEGIPLRSGTDFVIH